MGGRSALFRNAFSASAMWTANAATVSPGPTAPMG
jgi:succinylarginine dihydrolase